MGAKSQADSKWTGRGGMIEKQDNTEDRILISAMVVTFVHEDNAK